jgi:hypothetical protein
MGISSGDVRERRLWAMTKRGHCDMDAGAAAIRRMYGAL